MMLSPFKKPKGYIMRIKIKTVDGFQLVPIDDLIYIEANTPYTFVHHKNGEKIFCIETLKEFETKLNKKGFLRIHKSHLINLNAVDKVKKNGETIVKMCDGQMLKLARSKKKVFMEFFDRNFL